MKASITYTLASVAGLILFHLTDMFFGYDGISWIVYSVIMLVFAVFVGMYDSD